MDQLVLAVDFESTGLLVKSDRITEIGAVLWEVSTQTPLVTHSTLVYDTTYPELTPEISELTGITQEALVRFGIPPVEALKPLGFMLDQADFVVAHNGRNFDFPLVEAEWGRLGGIPERWAAIEKIDTSVDVPYPHRIATRKLTHLAAEHGFVNNMAHRAVFDVMSMLKVMSFYPFDEIVKLSRSADKLLRAVVTYDDRDKAKARGYRWDGERKIWIKTIKECHMEQEIKNAPFKVLVMESA